MLWNWGWLRRSQWFDRKRLAEIQGKKLREIIKDAYQTVPFYRKLYGAGLDVSTINLDNMSKLPIVTKELLRSTPLEERTAVGANTAGCRLVYTTGSTGIPLASLDDPYSMAYEETLGLRHAWALGIRPFDRMCRVATLPPPFLADRGLWSHFKRNFYRFLPASDPISKHVTEYLAWKPNALVANPWYYKVLTRFVEQTGYRLTFDHAITWGDFLDDQTRERTESIIHADVSDTYGLNETGGVAWECPTHAGYHINAESLVVEFLRNGEPVVAGEPGEMYVTSFNRTANPIIRYFTGDVATPIDDDCPCGRGLPLLKGIQGRVMDFVRTKSGRYISPYDVTVSLRNSFGVEQFKLIQKADFSIELLVKTSEKQIAEVIKAAEIRLKQLMGDLPIIVRIVDGFENEKGAKFRLVESRVADNSNQTFA